MGERYQPLDLGVVRRISEVIGNTEAGLIGREIERLLRETNLPDPGKMTKRERLYEALSAAQRRDHAANAVFRFLNAVMNPVRFVDNPDEFAEWRARLSTALAFSGYEIGEEGRVRRRSVQARTISEARARANRFRDKLCEREVHPAVLRACADEIRDENYFHSVFEAAKSLADRIQDKAGLTSDGVRLVDEAFGRRSGLPLLAFNRLENRTDESEHDGYANQLRGLFGAFRNTTAHRLKVEWPIGELDALDMMSTASLLHRRLDSAVPVPEHVRQAAA